MRTGITRFWTLTVVAALAVGLGACSGDGGESGADVVGQDVLACESAADCVSANPCMEGACEAGTCVFEPTSGSCDDNNACTQDDQCVEGTCRGTPVTCNDGIFCNGEEVCDPASGECVVDWPPNKDDNVDCTVDTCDEDSRKWSHTADNSLCDDDDPCTTGHCDPLGGCTFEPLSGACNDDDPCTVDDTCTDGTCAGTPKPCDDGLFCNGTETCEAETGICLDGEAPVVDDAVDCTADSCDEEADEVLHEPDAAACDDGNDCTAEVCDAEAGCQYENIEGPCDDGESCTQGDTCDAGSCIPGEWVCFEDCANQADDDKDDLVDCDDPDCTWEPVCLPAGEDCGTAWPLHKGEPLTLDGEVTFAASTVGLTDDFAGSCSADSAGSPDAVHVLTLAEPLGLSVTLDFAGSAWPALYVLDEACGAEVFCDAVFYDDLLETTVLLPAGTWHVVVDGNFVDGAGNGDQADYTLVLTPFAPAAAETICDDGLDDDADGLTDCADDDCAEVAACDTLSGESCAEAIALFVEPVTDDGEAWTVAVEGNTKGKSNVLAGSCDADTANSADMVYTFTTQDSLWLAASHDFGGKLYPALYLLDEGCDAGEEIACAKAGEGAAMISRPLPAGTWYLVVDGSFGQDAGPFTLSVELSSLPETEADCGDGLDDDLDGNADCDDDDCALDVACAGLPGDRCSQALPLNDGVPVTAADAGLVLNAQGTTKGLADDYAAACDADTGESPDAVYRLDLADPMLVSFAYDFEGGAWPALYVLAAACDPEAALGCATAFSGSAVLDLGLPAGTWYLVLDAAFAGDAAAYSLTLQFAAPPASELECQDGADDDVDGLADCADPDCAAETACLDLYEPNDEPAAAADLGAATAEPLSAQDGTMIYPAGDSDWFQVAVAEPGFLQVSAASSPELDLKVTLTDPQGAVLAEGDSVYGGDTEVVELPVYQEGSVYILITGFQDAVGSYELTVQLLPPSQVETACTDGVDEDLDGAVDCDDDNCTASAWCGGGDLCAAPNAINGGVPITADLVGLQLGYEGTTTGYAGEASGSCGPDTGSAADAYWSLEVAEPVQVTAQLTYAAFKYPALYLLEGGCEGVETACAAGTTDPVSITATLAAGTYILVVDGNWPEDTSDYELTLLIEAAEQ